VEKIIPNLFIWSALHSLFAKDKGKMQETKHLYSTFTIINCFMFNKRSKIIFIPGVHKNPLLPTFEQREAKNQ